MGEHGQRERTIHDDVEQVRLDRFWGRQRGGRQRNGEEQQHRGHRWCAAKFYNPKPNAQRCTTGPVAINTVQLWPVGRPIGKTQSFILF